MLNFSLPSIIEQMPGEIQCVVLCKVSDTFLIKKQKPKVDLKTPRNIVYFDLK